MSEKTPDYSCKEKDRPVHILIIEDEEDLAGLIGKAFLQTPHGNHLTIVHSLAMARPVIANDLPDLIIADWMLPDGTGIEILPRSGGVVTTPLIIFTGHGNENLAVEIMKSGAIDYVVKSENTLRDLPHIARRALHEWDNIQKRKKAEESLRSSDLKYRDLFENSGTGIVILDREGNYLLANKRAAGLLGAAPDEIVGKNLSDFFSPATAERYLRQNREVIDTREIREYEDTFELKTGKKSFLIIDECLKDSEGQGIAIQSSSSDITERKNAEQALQASESKYRQLHESISDAVATVDLEGVVQDFNPAFSTLLGYTGEELQQLTYRDLTPEKWHAVETKIIEDQVIVRGYSDVYEKEYRKRDGTVFPVEIRSFLLRDDKGRPTGMWGIIRDISERRRTELEIAESEENYRLLFENANDAVFLNDVLPDGMPGPFITVNKVACQQLGYTRDDLLKKSIRDIVVSDKSLKISEIGKKLLRDKQVTFEAVHRRKDGTEFPVEMSIHLFELRGRTVSLSFNRDITERKKSESALRETQEKIRESEEFLRTVITGAHEGILVYDRDLRITIWNRFMEEMTGISSSEVLGKNPADLFPFIREQGIDLLLKKARSGITSESHDIEFSFPSSGRKGWSKGIYSPNYDSHGTVIGVIGIIRDITSRKNAENALQESEVRFREQYQNNPLAIFTWQYRKGDFVLVDYNKAAGMLSHSRADEFVGKTASEMYLTRPELIADVGQCFKERTVISKDLVSEHFLPGRHIHTTAAFVPPDLIMVHMEDVTDRKAAEDSLRQKHRELNAAYGRLTSAEQGLRESYEKLEKSQASIRESENRYRNLFENMMEGFAYCQMIFDEDGSPSDFIYLNVNQAFNRIIGPGVVIGKRVTEVFPGIRETMPQIFEIYGRVARTGNPESFELDFKPSGKWLYLSVYSPERGFFVATFEDITQHKFDEDVRDLSRQVLQLSYEQDSLHPLLEMFVSVIQDYTGCDSVGIRILDNQGNIPYAAYAGFTKNFYEMESPLSIINDQCMCINVIKETTDPHLPFYTSGGSFYMNGTTKFLATVSSEDKGKTRNVCNEVGYESVALVPFREHDRILGLIHLADHHDDMVPIRIVEVIEKIATSIGEAVKRLQVEEELKKSEIRFRSLIQNSSDIIRILDATGRIIYDSPSSERLLGYPAGFFIGKNPLDFVHPDDRKRVTSDLQMVLSKENSGIPTEFRIRKADGEYIYVDSIGINLIGVPGIDGIVITTRPVQERKMAELAIAESEEKFRTLVENVVDVFYRSDRNGVLIYSSPSVLTLTGYPSMDDVIGRPIASFWENPEDREKMVSLLGEHGNVKDYEVTIVRFDGTKIPVSISSHFYRDESGAIAGVEGVIRDISERKKYETDLRESEEKFRSIFDTDQDALIVFEITANGMPGKIIDANTTSCTQLGYTKDELQTKNFFEINADEYWESALNQMAGLYLRGNGSYESVRIKKDGERFPVEVRVHRMKLQGRDVIVSSARDVSDRRRQEKSLKISNQKLHLMNIVAWHDIQNKITGLRGYVELTKDIVTDEKGKAFVKTEEDVLKVIDQQIQYTKEYQQMGVAPPEWLRIGDMLRRVLGNQNAGSLDVATDVGDLEIFCDPTVEKAFAYLVGYTLDPSRNADIVRVYLQKKTNGLVLCYDDNGTGISLDKKKEIFHRDVAKFSGFGMFFIHDILDISDMGISEVGDPEKGVRFEISVPKGIYRYFNAGEKKNEKNLDE